MRQHRLLLLPALAVIVAASACSNSGDDTGGAAAPAATHSSSVPNPCTLVAVDQLAPLVGATPVTTGPTEQFRGTTCHWEAGAANGTSLDLTVWPGREFFSTTPGATPVTGLGDEAEVDARPHE